MARAIEFMQVTKILETMTRTPGQDMAIQVTIGLLGAREELNRPVDQDFELCVFMMLQVGAGSLEPFGHV